MCLKVKPTITEDRSSFKASQQPTSNNHTVKTKHAVSHELLLDILVMYWNLSFKSKLGIIVVTQRPVSSIHCKGGEARGMMGLRMGGAAVWGHWGGRVCSAESNVSPRYQNFFINEDTQTSEGRGWGFGTDEGAVCKHTSPPLRWLAVPDLTTCFLAAAPS